MVLTLAHLPDDVLNCIIESGFPHSIEALAATNRRIYAVCGPFLRRHYAFKAQFHLLALNRQWTTLLALPPPPAPDRTPLDLASADEPLSVLGQIARQPARGWYVRTLDLNRHALRVDELQRRFAIVTDWYAAHPRCLEADKAVLQSFIDESVSILEPSTSEMLEQHSRGSLPLLTEYLPNVRRLHYRYNIWSGGNPTIKFLCNAARAALDFPHTAMFPNQLDTLLMDFEGNAPKPSRLFADLLRLPKLKSVELMLINDLVLDFGDVDVLPLSIERLVLRMADLRNSIEWRGLSMMPFLTHLSFEFQPAHGHERTGLAMESLLTDINEWLPRTIQHVRLTMKCNFARQTLPIEPNRARLPTLRDCSQLKTLQCDVDFLTEPSTFSPPNAPLVPLLNVLPSSIEQILLIHREDAPYFEPTMHRSERAGLYRFLPDSMSPINKYRAKTIADRWARFHGLFKGLVPSSATASSLSESLPKLHTIWFTRETEHVFLRRHELAPLTKALEKQGLEVKTDDKIPDITFGPSQS